jgi:two-component system NarL family sensor kinase
MVRRAAFDPERLAAWVRLPALGLIAFGESLPHPDPEHTAFAIALAIFSAWSLAVLVYVHAARVARRFTVVATAVDIAAITVLTLLSGGPFSQARLAYFVLPLVVAFRFRPVFTALASVATTAAYLVQSALHPARHLPNAHGFIATQVGYLAWVGLAATALSVVVARRTRRVQELGRMSERLLAESLTAEERERQRLAEALHDRSIQNILSARHELQEAAEEVGHPGLARADAALADTVAELREAIFELHPAVVDHLGLAAALPPLAQRAARRGGFQLDLDLGYRERHPDEQLLLGVAGELLANAAQHSHAASVTVGLRAVDGELELEVADDGEGFDPSAVDAGLAGGHIGLPSQRVRVESIGGRLEIRSAPGAGTDVRLHVSL